MENHRIAIQIEDNAQLRGMVERYLKARGVKVHSAACYRTGLNLITRLAQDESYRASHFLVDLDINGGSGLDIVKKARDLEYTGRIVLLSGAVPHELIDLKSKLEHIGEGVFLQGKPIIPLERVYDSLFPR